MRSFAEATGMDHAQVAQDLINEINNAVDKNGGTLDKSDYPAATLTIATAQTTATIGAVKELSRIRELLEKNEPSEVLDPGR